MKEKPKIYGLIAEFDDPTKVVAAARSAHAAGYRKLDAYSPFPIPELWEAIDFRRSKLPLIVLIGGIVGCIGGFTLCYWASTTAYPMNVGGRPLGSWPSFIPITFECTILLAGLAAVFGMLALNGLPEPYHPVFNVPGFDQATRNRFFLCIESRDARFDEKATREFLEGLEAVQVTDVEY